MVMISSTVTSRSSEQSPMHGSDVRGVGVGVEVSPRLEVGVGVTVAVAAPVGVLLGNPVGLSVGAAVTVADSAGVDVRDCVAVGEGIDGELPVVGELVGGITAVELRVGVADRVEVTD